MKCISRIILRNEITRSQAIHICNYESYSHVALHKGNNLCSNPGIYEPIRAKFLIVPKHVTWYLQIPIPNLFWFGFVGLFGMGVWVRWVLVFIPNDTGFLFLENFMDHIVHEVVKSQTWLSNFHFVFPKAHEYNKHTVAIKIRRFRHTEMTRIHYIWVSLQSPSKC